MAVAPAATGTGACARCGRRGPVALRPGELCGSCLSDDAWEAYATRGPLVIGRAEVVAATAWRDERRPRRPWAHIALAVASTVAAAVAGLLTWRLFRAQPLGALEAIVARLEVVSWQAIAAGAAALILGVAGTIVLRRGRRVRSHAILSGHLAGIVAGAIAVLVGGLQARSFDEGLEYLSMPSLASIPGELLAPHFERVARSTVVIVAGDQDGDARFGAIGTGAVIAARPGRAWIVTCSHVAIPYEAPAAVRTPERARPVWVQLADGRGAAGRVVWTAPPPLDVAVVAVAVDEPPPAVEVSPTSEPLAPESPVLFVPNPYRNGWKIHRGTVERRERHATPAGDVSLVYTSLPLQPGDSGSGLYDGAGRLVGLNTWNRPGESGPHGISLPSDVLQSVLGRVDRGELEPAREEEP